MIHRHLEYFHLMVCSRKCLGSNHNFSELLEQNHREYLVPMWKSFLKFKAVLIVLWQINDKYQTDHFSCFILLVYDQHELSFGDAGYWPKGRPPSSRDGKGILWTGA